VLRTAAFRLDRRPDGGVIELGEQRNQRLELLDLLAQQADFIQVFRVLQLAPLFLDQLPEGIRGPGNR